MSTIKKKTTKKEANKAKANSKSSKDKNKAGEKNKEIDQVQFEQLEDTTEFIQKEINTNINKDIEMNNTLSKEEEQLQMEEKEIEEPSNLTIENFFKSKYEKFYKSNNKIQEIIKNSEKNPEIFTNKKNMDQIFLNLNHIYSLIKSNSNFFNFTKNILSKLEKENFFEEILLKIFYKISKNSENFSKKNLVFFLLIFLNFKIKSKVNIFEFFGENKKNEEIF